MTVKELIEILSKFPQDYKIVDKNAYPLRWAKAYSGLVYLK